MDIISHNFKNLLKNKIFLNFWRNYQFREYRKVCVNFKLLMILNINIQNLFMFLTKLNILYNDIFVKTAFLSLSNFPLDRLNFNLFSDIKLKLYLENKCLILIM